MSWLRPYKVIFLSLVVLSVTFIFLLSLTATSHAQELTTVGSLLDQGGTQLTKEELTALLKNATVSGVQQGTNAKYRNKYNDDGTLKGSAVLANGQNVGVFAKWSISENGNIQGDYSNSQGGRWKSSSFYYRLGANYFRAGASDRNAVANPIQIEK